MRSFSPMKTLFILFFFFASFSFASTYPVIQKSTPFSGSRFYVPNDNAKHKAVIMLHGSEGGSEPYLDAEANVLAMQGYAVLVYCYFDCNRGLVGPRKTLSDLEATSILDVVAWLRTQTLSNGKVAVYGFSRGGEFTMITGGLAMTKENRPDGLIAHTPSDTFNGAINWSWMDEACWLCKAGVGTCPDPEKHSDFIWNPSCGPDDPNLRDFSKSAWLVSGKSIPSNTRIEIEKYDGPILITVGEKDDLWPVDQTKRIEATLKAAGKPAQVYYFPEGKHSLRGADEIRRKELVLDFLQKL